jgi:sulfatase modifying factor 1
MAAVTAGPKKMRKCIWSYSGLCHSLRGGMKFETRQSSTQSSHILLRPALHRLFNAMAIAVLIGMTCTPAGCGSLDRPITSTESQPAVDVSVITNSIGVQFVEIPAGTFQMGIADGHEIGPQCYSERPRHLVTISRAFRLSRHEVTVGQFRRFVAETGYQTEAEQSGRGCNGLNLSNGAVERRPDWIWRSAGFDQTDQHPVVCVSWADAVAFCEWLSQHESARYRLPTEAEWEYACRAGTQTLLSTGDELQSLKGHANSGEQSLRNVFALAQGVPDWDDGYSFTAPVGLFHPNAFGLFDMHGNVGEWCSDWFDPQYYYMSDDVDPTGPPSSRYWRSVRGGSWYNTPSSCRSCGRHDGVPTAASTTNGFRIVME